MIDLNDSIWTKVNGGYRIPYDVSMPLKKLEGAHDSEEIDEVLNELWNELHHQGDVDVASYLALPHLVRICRSKNIFKWNFLALCAVIEQQRHEKRNPELPSEYIEFYRHGLKELEDLILANLKSKLPPNDLRTALSALATCKGSTDLGKAILELEGEVLTEFLEQF